jgi:hypothetical protein
MLEEILLSTAVWLAFGIVIALVILMDQRKHGQKGWLWPIVGFLLSLIGLLLWYMLVVRKRMVKAAEYPARPEYEAPSYKYERKEEAAPAAKQEGKKQVHQTEGAPRCESCGTAISVHDLKCPSCGKQLK